MVEQAIAKQQVDVLSPVVDQLIDMFGAARDAFNRHSRPSLDRLKAFKSATSKEVNAAQKRLAGVTSEKSEAARKALLGLHSVLNHLQIIGDCAAGLADPLEKKIKEGVLFSEKAVSQSNYLFNQQSGMLRSLLDIIITDNEFLKKYVVREGDKMIKDCNDFATEHETRLIEGLCLPQAAPIFLAILDRMRTVCQHEVDIVHLLTAPW